MLNISSGAVIVFGDAAAPILRWTPAISGDYDPVAEILSRFCPAPPGIRDGQSIRSEASTRRPAAPKGGRDGSTASP